VDWRWDRHGERKNAREYRPAARVAESSVGINSSLSSRMRGRKEGVLGKNAHVEEVQVKRAAGRRPGVWNLRWKRKKRGGRVGQRAGTAEQTEAGEWHANKWGGDGGTRGPKATRKPLSTRQVGGRKLLTVPMVAKAAGVFEFTTGPALKGKHLAIICCPPILRIGVQKQKSPDEQKPPRNE